MLCSNGTVSSTKWTNFFLCVNYDNVRTEFRNNDIYRKGAPCGGKARHIGKDLDVVGVSTDGVFQLFQNVDKNRIMTPGKSALVKENRTRIQNMNKGFLVTTEFAFGLRSFAPCFEIRKGRQEVN